MKIKIVYFAYLIPNKWETIVEEQLSQLKESSLYNEADEIFMSVIADDIELNNLILFLKNKYPKITIINVFKDNVYEFPGIKTLYEIAQNDDDTDTVLLCFHSKGMMSNQHATRNCLFKYTIENYKQYIDEFDNNKLLEVAGAIPHIAGFIYFNFFWCRSSYVKNYCSEPIVSENRYIWEIWIGSQYSRKYKVITYSPIIKYEQVTNYHEVWEIHDKMIQNHF